MDLRGLNGSSVPIVGQRETRIPVWPVYLVWDEGAEVVQIGTTAVGPMLQRGDVRSFEVWRESAISGAEPVWETVHVEIDRVVHRTMRYGPQGLFLVGHRVEADASIERIVAHARPRD